MANEVIGIEVQVKLEQLRAQLATLGPGMDKEAKAMTAALAKEIKKQTAALKAGTKNGLSGFGAEAGAAATKFDKLAKAAGPLGGVLARISPEAGAAAASLAGLTGAAEGVAAGLGVSLGVAAAAMAALATVLGTAFLAYKVYNAESERAEELAASVATATAKLSTVHDEAHAATLRLKVATGELTEAQAANLKISEDAAKRLSAGIGTTTQKIRELEKAQSSVWTQMVDGATSGQMAFNPLLFIIDALTTSSQEFQVEIDELNGVVKEGIAKTEEQTTADKKALEIAAQKAAAAKAAAAAIKKAAEEAEEADAATARAMARRDAEMQALDDRRELSGKRAKKRAEEAAKQAAADARQAAADSKAELARIEKEAAARTAALQVNLSTTASVAASIGSVWDQLNQQKLDGIDTSTKAGRAAAMKQWEENKAASLAMATVQAALAIAMAVASFPPPFNIPGIVANTVAGGAAIASIAAAPPPAFHAGTSMVAPPLGGHPDEMSATLRRGEAVVSAVGVAAAGREMVGRWNSGRSAEAQQPLVMQYRHQVFNRFIRDNLRMSTPLSAAVSSGTASGFRNRG
jgi:hypothetical protein